MSLSMCCCASLLHVFRTAGFVPAVAHHLSAMVAIVYRLNDAIVLAIATAVVAALVFAMLALLCCCSPGCGAACAVLRWSVKAPLLMLRLGVQAAASAAAYGYRLLAIGSHTPRDARPAIGSHTSVEADTPLSDGGGLRRRVFAADGSDGENAAEDPRTLQALYEDAALLFADDEQELLAPRRRRARSSCASGSCATWPCRAR